jgi:hypothetical protein
MGRALILTNQGIRVDSDTSGSFTFGLPDPFTITMFTVPANSYAVIEGVVRIPAFAAAVDADVTLRIDGIPVWRYYALYDLTNNVYRVGSSKFPYTTPGGSGANASRSFQEAQGFKGIHAGPGSVVSVVCVPTTAVPNFQYFATIYTNQ